MNTTIVVAVRSEMDSDRRILKFGAEISFFFFKEYAVPVKT